MPKMNAPAASVERMRIPRARRERHPAAMVSATLIAAIVLVPIASIVAIALSGTGADWPHLARNVLPRSTATTLWLLAMVSAGTASIGVTGAWLVVAFDFPFRRFLAWALVLPLAVPTYLAAYAFGEFFHFTGPVQTGLRYLFGFQTMRDYWFPDIRTTEGAAIVLSSVLYPYVYLTTRVVFIMQGRNIADVARTLGARPSKVFFRILLPVARPAVVAGVALVLMETVNDIGAVEYLGVRTLTFSVYSTWLNRGSLEGAAQIAMVMLVLVLAILQAERWARRRQRFHGARATHMRVRPPRVILTGWRRWLATCAVLMPVLTGFGIPLLVFGDYASRRLEQLGEPALRSAFVNSVLTAGATALVTVFAAMLMINAARISRSSAVGGMARLASSGYALPGTILGLGLLFALTRLDNAIDGFLRLNFGVSSGLLFTGTAGAVVLACSIRFLALAEGAIRSGMEKLPPHLDEAARSLGRSPLASAREILLPLLRPAILTAAVLVFVDTVKELSATILLRPFGFSTLATHVYENASRGVIEDGAVAALLIIVTALVPVILLSGALMRDSEASHS
ncbi:iron ABC transporter permease [Aquibium oceanicum]|uniref:Iron ABC transporter permease n=2 Tax=Aquibium oceanicum TaxID=1670800 RepID=A0A1L3SV34_9HYPH|nr:iron ABC transporter permease [Aquibium oceanicum]